MAIQIRRGTNAEWESNKSNIVVGEPAIATDECRFFIGTGTGTFAEMANIENLADAFDSTATYAVGDYCTYQGKLYKFTSAHSGAWSSGDVSEGTVDAEIALKADANDIPSPSNANPQMDGTASAGVSADYSRADHVHPSDISRASAVEVSNIEEKLLEHNIIDSIDVINLGNYTIGPTGILAANDAYKCVAVDTRNFKSFKTNGYSSAVCGYFSNYPQWGGYTYDGTRHFDIHGNVTVPSQCNYFVICVTNLSAVITAVTGNEDILDAVDRIDFDVTALKDITIEGYDKEREYVGTTTKNYVKAYADGSLAALNNWEYNEYNCEAFEELVVSGYSGTTVSLFYVYDANGNVVASYPFPSGNTAYFDVSVKIPKNGVKICVNGNYNLNFPALIAKTSYHFEQASIGTETLENRWSVGTGKMKTIIELFGSYNHAFNFISLLYNNGSFKSVDDDIAPMNFINAGYVGANHGYNFGYKATLNEHGLTASDIGKTCEINGDTWVLIKIDDADHFTVVCRDTSKWFGMKTVSPVPTTFDFGTSITVTNISLGQIHPSIKNIDVSVIENSDVAFVVSESYDIINPKNGIAELISNVGSNDNDSFVNLSDPAVTVRNVYTFDRYSNCVIYQNVKSMDNTVPINFYGGVQSSAFSTSDYYAVPLTSYDSFQASDAETSFGKSAWDDENIPPVIYLQINNSGATSNKMILQGILMSDRVDSLADSAGFIYTSRKMYPYAIEPKNTFAHGHTFNLTSFRIPMYKNDISDDAKFVGFCKVGNDYYLFAYNPTQTDASISVPSELVGKEIETVLSKNASCLNKLVSAVIDISFNGEGYIFLKLA